MFRVTPVSLKPHSEPLSSIRVITFHMASLTVVTLRRRLPYFRSFSTFLVVGCLRHFSSDFSLFLGLELKQLPDCPYLGDLQNRWLSASQILNLLELLELEIQKVCWGRMVVTENHVELLSQQRCPIELC